MDIALTKIFCFVCLHCCHIVLVENNSFLYGTPALLSSNKAHTLRLRSFLFWESCGDGETWQSYCLKSGKVSCSVHLLGHPTNSSLSLFRIKNNREKSTIAAYSHLIFHLLYPPKTFPILFTKTSRFVVIIVVVRDCERNDSLWKIL